MVMEVGRDHFTSTASCSTSLPHDTCHSDDPAVSTPPPAARPSPSGRQDEQPRNDLEHQSYLDSLPVPTLAEIQSIATAQEAKEAAVEGKYDAVAKPNGGEGTVPGSARQATAAEREAAAGAIQRTYRGHRARRELQGLSLDPSSRWTEAIREARYRNLTTPKPRQAAGPDDAQEGNENRRRSKSDARTRWQQISRIARHAHGEEDDDDDAGSAPSEPSSAKEDMSATQKVAHARHKRLERKEKEAWKGKMMDLPYFLEMVDLKHRYGSHLRTYHAKWKEADTHENFFYWLDYGEGRDVEVPKVSREKLERDQVRYLSREERMQYLVKVDSEGRLRWWKNNELIDTTDDYRDSVRGIVTQEDKTKKFRQDELEVLERKYHGQAPPAALSATQTGSQSSSVSRIRSGSSDASVRYPDPPEFTKAKGPKKVAKVTPDFILNRLLRKSSKKNTWIYVADTRMNMYVGIKQSGAFQHSSFMHGSRISAAGQIKIKRGQLRSLSPLSGHYRPPTSAFRHFIQHMKAENVDMSRVSVSKSYAVLVGLETYMGAKAKTKHVGDEIKEGAEWIVHPDKARQRKEQEKDKSRSAQIAEARQREMEEQMNPFGAKFRVLGAKVGDKWADRASRPGTSTSKGPLAIEHQIERDIHRPQQRQSEHTADPLNSVAVGSTITTTAPKNTTGPGDISQARQIELPERPKGGVTS